MTKTDLLKHLRMLEPEYKYIKDDLLLQTFFQHFPGAVEIVPATDRLAQSLEYDELGGFFSSISRRLSNSIARSELISRSLTQHELAAYHTARGGAEAAREAAGNARRRQRYVDDVEIAELRNRIDAADYAGSRGIPLDYLIDYLLKELEHFGPSMMEHEKKRNEIKNKVREAKERMKLSTRQQNIAAYEQVARARRIREYRRDIEEIRKNEILDAAALAEIEMLERLVAIELERFNAGLEQARMAEAGRRTR